MPVYLPPISRRQFIGRALGAAAAAALGQGGAAVAEDAGPRERWALLSDTHIAANPEQFERGVNMTDNLRAVTNEVLAWPDRPQSLLMNGDLAWTLGEKTDYGAVSGLIEPLRRGGMGAHLSLGNHDNRERFWEALRADKTSPADLPDKQACIVHGACANWFILDSLMETAQTPGLLGKEQRKWLARSLDANAGRPAIICIHHHPGLLLLDQLIALQDSVQLLEILRPRRQVKAYFFGHTHRWNISRDPSGIHLINLPPVAYVFEHGRPNGWMFAEVRPDGARLELRCLDQGHKDHGRKTDLSWRV